MKNSLIENVKSVMLFEKLVLVYVLSKDPKDYNIIRCDIMTLSNIVELKYETKHTKQRRCTREFLPWKPLNGKKTTCPLFGQRSCTITKI